LPHRHGKGKQTGGCGLYARELLVNCRAVIRREETGEIVCHPSGLVPQCWSISAVKMLTTGEGPTGGGPDEEIGVYRRTDRLARCARLRLARPSRTSAGSWASVSRRSLAGSVSSPAWGAEVRRLRQLGEENRPLKPRVADLTLDQHLLQEVIRKKWSSPLSAGSWCRVCELASRSVSDARAP
jgi:hypothetical protein